MSASARPLPPRLDGYDRFALLGRGGTASVWSARQVSLGREVAVKVLDPASEADPGAVDRFQAEARLAARLAHPGVVRVFDVFFRDGRCCIVMEKLTGATLASRIKVGGPLREEEAVAAALQVVSALDHAWRRARLVHRDLKPENVMVCADGAVKVMDFGLCAPAPRRAPSPTPGASGRAEAWVWGTPAYMPPEQAAGIAAPAPQADMYSLGATLFHAVTGRRLFSSLADDSAVMVAQASAVDVSPRALAPALSPQFCAFVRRLLAKDPKNRFIDWDAVRDALLGLQRRPPRFPPPLPRGRRRAAAGRSFSTVAPEAFSVRAAAALRSAAGRLRLFRTKGGEP